MRKDKKFYILGCCFTFLMGCSNHQLNKSIDGTYASSISKEYPFAYNISFYRDGLLHFDEVNDSVNGIMGEYSKIDEDSYLLSIDDQEFIINLDRKKMQFEFPIEYEDKIYVVIFEKITNVPVIVEY